MIIDILNNKEFSHKFMTEDEAFRTPYSAAGGSMRNSLESDRDQNLPLEASLGELIDNSFEWRAHNVWIEYEAMTSDGWGPASKLMILDDGLGMEQEKLPNCLTVGFHDAYGGDQESSVSKYGVGAKYAFFNTCRKNETWSKIEGDEWYKAEFDFDDIALDKSVLEAVKEHLEGKGNGYPLNAVREDPPVEYKKMWKNLKSGTLIRWSNFDKDTANVYGDDELIWWIQRAFRNFIGNKIVHGVVDAEGKFVEKKIIVNPDVRNIWFNRKKLFAYDPLYQIPFKEGDVGETDTDAPVPQSIIFNHWIDDPEVQKKLGKRTAPVIIHFGISPRAWRTKSGSVWTKKSGQKESARDPENIQGRRIQGGTTVGGGHSWWDSRQFISILRNGREVGRMADHLLVGKRREDSDRWFGIAIEFTPALDKAFNVRNIKFEIEPNSDLRRKIRQEIQSTIMSMQNEVRDYWEEQRSEEEQRLNQLEIKNQKGKTGEPPLSLPTKPQQFTQENPEMVGDLPDTPETPQQLLEKIFGDNLQNFTKKDLEKELAQRKLVIRKDIKRQVPKDTSLMFEYSAQGGSVVQFLVQNHPYYSGLTARYEKMIELITKADEILENENPDSKEMKAILSKLQTLFMDIEHIRDIGMNAAVIALARQDPKGEAVKFRDIFLRDWGDFCYKMYDSQIVDSDDEQ
jgi:hypothetical protein